MTASTRKAVDAMEETVTRTARDLGDKLETGAKAALRTTEEVAGQARRKAGELSDTAQDAMDDGRSRMGEVIRKARDRAGEAGAAIAAGAALACLFPRTETEDRLLGEARDRLVADLKSTARAEVVRTSDLARSLSSALGRDMDRAGTLLRADQGWHRTRVSRH